MTTHKRHQETHKPDSEPSVEILSENPPEELRIRFTETEQYVGSVSHISSRFKGILDFAIENSWTNQVAPNFTIMDRTAARQAIEYKARELGGMFTGWPGSDIEQVGVGFVRHYQGCDIYYSDLSGAHEVHGDIRAKYDNLQGAKGDLGFPLTDETGTPDGIGRYNHFERGSIYWTPTTGPMEVRGAVRNYWASTGWERGGFGYPVTGSQRWRYIDQAKSQHLEWSVFQNGAICSSGDRVNPALVAELPPNLLAQFVRDAMDKEFHKSPDNVGIQGGGRVLRVRDWGYGFWSSRPRRVTFEINGFHDNGLAPDTTFRIELPLEFDLVWPISFIDDVTKTVVAKLTDLWISVDGLASGTIYDKLWNSIWATLKEPYAVGDIEASYSGVDILLIDVQVTPAGALQLLLAPDFDNPSLDELRRSSLEKALREIKPR